MHPGCTGSRAERPSRMRTAAGVRRKRLVGFPREGDCRRSILDELGAELAELTDQAIKVAHAPCYGQCGGHGRGDFNLLDSARAWRPQESDALDLTPREFDLPDHRFRPRATFRDRHRVGCPLLSAHTKEELQADDQEWNPQNMGRPA